MAEASVERCFPPAVQSVPDARRWLREFLVGHDRQDLCDQVEVAVSELVTNAVLHAGTAFEVRLLLAGPGMRVEVRDESHHLPRRPGYTVTARTGRGMGLVERYADRWGVDRTSRGKSVWFEVGGEPVVGSTEGVVEARVDPAVPVVLLEFPLLLHWAWQEHAQAMMREHVLARIEEHPEVLEEHAAASDALAVLHEQVPEPSLPYDPADLLAEGLDPTVTLDVLRLEVPAQALEHFATLDRVLAEATATVGSGRSLGSEVRPEIHAFHTWVCGEVAGQVGAGAVPVPWGTEGEGSGTRHA